VPLPPLTATVTDNACVVVMLVGFGVTVTVGINCCAVSPIVLEILAL
jgi:hypothetical protein